MENYDFIELVVPDVHGFAKGRLVSNSRMDDVVKNGMGLYSAICYGGPCGEINTSDDFIKKVAYSNIILKPDLVSLAPVTSSTKGQHKVGQVFCHLETIDGVLDKTAPRTAAMIQLEKLANLGLSLKSTFELEFLVENKQGTKIKSGFQHWGQLEAVHEMEELLLDLLKEMKDIGVTVDTIVSECAPDQYELTPLIADGVKSADDVTRFKTGSRVFFSKRDYDVMFMTRPRFKEFSSGFHFNHSLWTADGQNAFLDQSKPDKLSELGSHWLAGVLEHAPALTALFCPTINCYRRLHQPWVPSSSNWGKQNRFVSLRLKVEGASNVYLENRIPSSACNPYLVMAAVVAAGIDGIKRKLILQAPEVDGRPLPRTLEEALKMLEEDEVMVEALGGLVKHFVYAKREFELRPWKQWEGCSAEEKYQKEMNMYQHF